MVVAIQSDAAQKRDESEATPSGERLRQVLIECDVRIPRRWKTAEILRSVNLGPPENLVRADIDDIRRNDEGKQFIAHACHWGLLATVLPPYCVRRELILGAWTSAKMSSSQSCTVLERPLIFNNSTYKGLIKTRLSFIFYAVDVPDLRPDCGG